MGYYALLESFSFNELLSFYQLKFPFNDIKVVMDAFAEIDIADDSEDPVLVKPSEWPIIKENIIREWKNFQAERLDLKEREKEQRLRNAEEILKNKKNSNQ